ncbi:c-type cytochrome [Devosia aquimaris]|uniref:c-type cytochrome n=1 Tax=Devosia aquimaris TaxID=2866214 RepID=UPI001CD0CC92|nr:cytochrome c [Devosia sp. CJK-A8-3]
MKILTTLAIVLLAALPAHAAERGAKVNFVLKCAGCHLNDGTGMPASGIPDFVGKVGVFAAVPEGRAYLLHVPGVIGSSLSDAQIADVLNYIMDTWAGESLPADYVPFDAAEVRDLRLQDIGNAVKYRRVVVEKLEAMGLSAADYPWP